MTFGTLHLFLNVIFSELHGRVASQQPSKNNSGIGVGHHAGHWEPRATRGNRVLVLVKAGLESVITSMVGLSREEGRADARDKGAPSLGAPAEEGDLNGEWSGKSKAQLGDVGMDNLDKRGLMGGGRSTVM